MTDQHDEQQVVRLETASQRPQVAPHVGGRCRRFRSIAFTERDDVCGLELQLIDQDSGKQLQPFAVLNGIHAPAGCTGNDQRVALLCHHRNREHQTDRSRAQDSLHEIHCPPERGGRETCLHRRPLRRRNSHSALRSSTNAANDQPVCQRSRRIDRAAAGTPARSASTSAPVLPGSTIRPRDSIASCCSSRSLRRGSVISTSAPPTRNAVVVVPIDWRAATCLGDDAVNASLLGTKLGQISAGGIGRRVGGGPHLLQTSVGRRNPHVDTDVGERVEGRRTRADAERQRVTRRRTGRSRNIQGILCGNRQPAHGLPPERVVAAVGCGHHHAPAPGRFPGEDHRSPVTVALHRDERARNTAGAGCHREHAGARARIAQRYDRRQRRRRIPSLARVVCGGAELHDGMHFTGRRQRDAIHAPRAHGGNDAAPASRELQRQHLFERCIDQPPA